MRKFKCTICGYVYDEAAGIPDMGAPPGTRWEDLPEGFVCPVCTAPRSVFRPLDEPVPEQAPQKAADIHIEAPLEFSAGEISVICSNLAKGCEKQRLLPEMEAFNKLAECFKSKTPPVSATMEDARAMLDEDLSVRFVAAHAAANADADRGALRSLVWSEKVSAMAASLLGRFAKEGDAMLAGTKIFVCDTCGFVYLGDTPPEVCPVCKVPRFKITLMERR